ncbi:hypothetical protein, partial [Comamonas koreensis]
MTIPAGQSYVYFSVSGIEVGSTQIEATAEGATAAEPFVVEVVTPTVIFNSLDVNRTTSSVRDDFSISLRVPGARYQDNQYALTALAVNVSLSDQAPAGVVNGIYDQSGNLITQITIPKGQVRSTSGYVAQPTAAGTYRVSVDISGIVNVKSDLQTVSAAQEGLRLGRENGTKAVVGKGLYSYYTGEVYVERLINGAAGSGANAVTVSLRCVAESVCTVPATVTIPAGQSFVYFSVTGIDIGSTQIEATAAGFDSSVLNTETISPLMSLRNVPGSLKAGQTYNSVFVSAIVPGARYQDYQYPATNLTITFSSSIPSVGTVTNTVNWAANSSSSSYATFTAISPGTTQITASSPGFVP